MNNVFPKNVRLRFIVNSVSISKEYEVGNEKELPIRQLMGEIGILLRCFTRGFCTIERLVYCPSYVAIYVSSTKAVVYPNTEDSCTALDSSIDPTVITKSGSLNGVAQLRFERVTTAALLETMLREPRAMHADVVENIFLLTYPLVFKGLKRSQNCSCISVCMCADHERSVACNLLITVIYLATLTGNSKIAGLKVREWRDSVIRFLTRWLVVCYPEDVDNDVIEMIRRLAGHYTVSNDEYALRKLNMLVKYLEERRTASSSPASLLYYMAARFSETLNFDLLRMREIAERFEWSALLFRVAATVSVAETDTYTATYDQLCQQFIETLQQSTPYLALMLTYYFVTSYLNITPRDLSELACGKTTQNVRRLIERHNALARLIQLSVFGLTVSKAVAARSDPAQVIYIRQSEPKRAQIIVYLTYLTYLLYELGCVEGVFCIVSAVQTQVCWRVLTYQQRYQAISGFSGTGPDLNYFGKVHLQAGIERGSRIAQSFFEDGHLMYDKYIPYYQRGKRLFDEHEKMQNDYMYSLQELEIMVKQNLAKNEKIKYYENIYAFAWKLGKPVDAIYLVSMEGNYKRYRTFIAAAIRNKAVIIPYLGILSRDLVFTCDGNPSYFDEKTKQILNFYKLYIVYDYILTYLAPQANLLGYCSSDDRMYFSSNVVVRNIRESLNSELLRRLDYFAGTIDSLIDEDAMWELSRLVRPKTLE